MRCEAENKQRCRSKIDGKWLGWITRSKKEVKAARFVARARKQGREGAACPPPEGPTHTRARVPLISSPLSLSMSEESCGGGGGGLWAIFSARDLKVWFTSQLTCLPHVKASSKRVWNSLTNYWFARLFVSYLRLLVLFERCQETHNYDDMAHVRWYINLTLTQLCKKVHNPFTHNYLTTQHDNVEWCCGGCYNTTEQRPRKINGDSEKKRTRIKKHTQEKNPHPRCVCARAFAVAADIVKNVRRRQRRR